MSTFKSCPVNIYIYLAESGTVPSLQILQYRSMFHASCHAATAAIQQHAPHSVTALCPSFLLTLSGVSRVQCLLNCCFFSSSPVLQFAHQKTSAGFHRLGSRYHHARPASSGAPASFASIVGRGVPRGCFFACRGLGANAAGPAETGTVPNARKTPRPEGGACRKNLGVSG